MKSLILPEMVTLQLVDRSESPLSIPNVLFRITAFARRKSNFLLQPFASDHRGLVAITKRELEAGALDCYDSGLMDYAHISDCFPSVEIRLLTDEEVMSALDARKIWKKLLAGERQRWKSLEQLSNLYKNASNDTLIANQSPAMRVNWSKDDNAEYAYKFVVVPREMVINSP